MLVFKPPEKRFLSDEQRAQVAALFDAMLPGNDSAPGAAEAGAVDYLDLLLGRDPESYYEIEPWREMYTAALPVLDGAVDGGLAGASREQVTELIARLQKGEIEGVDGRRFFGLLRNHCIEGCFADPRWGGNKDGLMWRWLGSHAPPEEVSLDGR